MDQEKQPPRTLLGLIKESQGEIKWNGNLVIEKTKFNI